jgi:hypothetical protein
MRPTFYSSSDRVMVQTLGLLGCGRVQGYERINLTCMSRIGKKEYKVQEEGGKGTRARYSIPHTVGHDIDSGIGLSITIDKLRRCQQRVLIRRGCVLVSDSGTAVDSENVPIDTFSSLDTFSDSTHFPTHEIASFPIVAPSGSQTFTRRNLFFKKAMARSFTGRGSMTRGWSMTPACCLANTPAGRLPQDSVFVPSSGDQAGPGRTHSLERALLSQDGSPSKIPHVVPREIFNHDIWSS